MLPKITIPKGALNFIMDKTADFFVSRLSKKVDDFQQSKSIQLSEKSFERELRKDLECLNNNIKNLEAVVYQGKQLYEMSLTEIIKQLNSIPTTNIYINGNVTLTVNFSTSKSSEDNGEIDFLSTNKIRSIIRNNANHLFKSINSQYQSSTENNTSQIFSSIIYKRNKELQTLREED